MSPDAPELTVDEVRDRAKAARLTIPENRLEIVRQLMANALKPVVLPGETMQLFILKEGKEPNQGVGYLDDGTMVVVDNAKRFLGRNIEVTITSVLQTTAGKMFFGKSESHDDVTPLEQRPRRTGA